MKFLITHGEKLVCAVIVVLCGVWVYMSLGADTAAKQKAIKDAQDQIRQYLDNNPVKESWAYHESNLTGYANRLKGHVASAEQPLLGGMESYAFYPRPERPMVEEKKEVRPDVVTVTATLPKFGGLSVDAQQGSVALGCQRPEKMEYFAPVRIEVQRGTAPDKLDKKIHVFDLGPETGVATTGDVTKKEGADEQPDESIQERSGTTARSSKKRGTSTAAKKTTSKTEAATATLRFEDTEVEAKTTYYYRARLVARLVTMGPNNVIFREGKEVTILVPDDIEKVPGQFEGTTLYASPWSPVTKASIPDNFQLRFNFVTGKVPEDPRSPQVGYGVFFGVQLWDVEARAWSESSFEVPVGQPIAGKQKFKVKGTTKIRDFDTGLVLSAVRTAIKFETEKVKEFVTEVKTDDNGEEVRVPVVDETGQPKWVERLVPRRIPTQVAVLKVGDTDKEIRLIKGMGYGEELPADVKILMEGEAEPVLEQPKAEQPAKKAAEATGAAKTEAAVEKVPAKEAPAKEAPAKEAPAKEAPAKEAPANP